MTHEERVAKANAFRGALNTMNTESFIRVQLVRDIYVKQRGRSRVSLDRVLSNPEEYPELYDMMYAEFLNMKIEGVI